MKDAFMVFLEKKGIFVNEMFEVQGLRRDDLEESKGKRGFRNGI